MQSPTPSIKGIVSSGKTIFKTSKRSSIWLNLVVSLFIKMIETKGAKAYTNNPPKIELKVTVKAKGYILRLSALLNT